ncbi:hypothetical protein H5T51_01875 [Candidatus Bathyarchaeota archaeon]|nr:hypothetical protein [Candidatus Bathyarchaeota archaeon]
MALHVVPETLEELKTANPVFLDELAEFGKVLYAKYPLEVFIRPVKLKPYTLIFYDLSDLSVKEKMRVLYLLYRKKGKGLVAEAGGRKLRDGCILLPRETAEGILNALKNFRVKTWKIEVFLSEDSRQRGYRSLKT